MRDCTKPENYHDLVESARHCAGDGNCQACEYDTTLNCMRHLISDAADVIEDLLPKRGKWIYKPKDAIEMMFTLPKCSVCGHESSDANNYCPNCGSQMRGEVNERD